MKRPYFSWLCCILAMVLLLSAPPQASALENQGALCPDLSQMITDPVRRQFVQSTVNYHLLHDPAIRQTLEDGYCCVFFFEGCSDNMNDPELKDLSYYRVSAVCLALRLDSSGNPRLIYFNGNCSTLPDRPLEYAARKEEIPWDVGPATVRDGTYPIYSVRHRGEYEALHVRTSYDDVTVPAVYMCDQGFTEVGATMINIHTRTGNHILKKSMWSEGCILVGDGEFWNFAELIASSYYPVYRYFVTDVKVGTVTINRQMLREEMYKLYQNVDAVDLLLSNSDPYLPATYLQQCQGEDLPQAQKLWTARDTALMSLPCSPETDIRSVQAATLEAGLELELTGSIRNTRGALWYPVAYDGQSGYVYSGDLEEPRWYDLFLKGLFN